MEALEMPDQLFTLLVAPKQAKSNIAHIERSKQKLFNVKTATLKEDIDERFELGSDIHLN